MLKPLCYELLGNSQDPKIPCFLVVSVPVTHWAVKVRFWGGRQRYFSGKVTPTKQPMRIFHQLGNRHTLRFDPRMAWGISMVKGHNSCNFCVPSWLPSSFQASYDQSETTRNKCKQTCLHLAGLYIYDYLWPNTIFHKLIKHQPTNSPRSGLMT